METNFILELIKEIRRDNQIPPYISDDVITDLVQDGVAELSTMVHDADFEHDMMARSILKSYVLYAHNKMIDEFYANHGSRILLWQLSHPVKEGDDEETANIH